MNESSISSSIDPATKNVWVGGISTGEVQQMDSCQ